MEQKLQCHKMTNKNRCSCSFLFKFYYLAWDIFCFLFLTNKINKFGCSDLYIGLKYTVQYWYSSYMYILRPLCIPKWFNKYLLFTILTWSPFDSSSYPESSLHKGSIKPWTMYSVFLSWHNTEPNFILFYPLYNPFLTHVMHISLKKN